MIICSCNNLKTEDIEAMVHLGVNSCEGVYKAVGACIEDSCSSCVGQVDSAIKEATGVLE